MRVLVVNDYATATGGAELLVLGLRDGLRRRGHEARLFASRARPLNQQVMADDSCYGTTASHRTLLQTANPWASRALRRVVAGFRPDVVHVKMFLTQLSPLALMPLRGVPVVYHIAWLRPICPLGSKMRPDASPCFARPGLVCWRARCLPLRDWAPLMLQLALFRRLRGAIDLMVTSSKFMRQRLAGEGLEPVDVIPNGVPLRERRAALAGAPTVAFSGRLVPEKGADTLLRAFARVRREVPGARLIVVGDGPQRGGLERLLGELGLEDAVEMAGHLARERSEGPLREAWVQAVPSRWEEPFGLVAAEAMMRGTAVVASDHGGLSEIVREGRTGFKVPPGDVDALARRLIEALGNRDLCERLGRAGREVALAEYGEDDYVDGFVHAYEALLRTRGDADER